MGIGCFMCTAASFPDRHFWSFRWYLTAAPWTFVGLIPFYASVYTVCMRVKLPREIASDSRTLGVNRAWSCCSAPRRRPVFTVGCWRTTEPPSSPLYVYFSSRRNSPQLGGGDRFREAQSQCLGRMTSASNDNRTPAPAPWMRWNWRPR